MSTTPVPPPATQPAGAPSSTANPFAFWAFVVVFVLAGVMAYSFHAEHAARAKAEATAKSAQLVIDQDDKARKAEAAADTERDKQTAAQIADLRAKAASQKTPKQIIKWIPAQLPEPKPITASITPATKADPVPDAVFDVPQVDLLPLRDQVANCQAQAIAAPACAKDLASKDLQLKQAGEQLSKMTKERDAYKSAAGQTKWSRAKKVLEIAAGVGAGFLIGRGTK